LTLTRLADPGNRDATEAAFRTQEQA